MNNTLAQQCSSFALKKIQSLDGDRSAFAKLVAGIPAMILQNGFGQTLAFLLAKSTDKKGHFVQSDRHLRVFDIISEWLNKRDILKGENRDHTMIALSELPQEDYLFAQEEALKVLEWVKRYASAGLFSK